MWTGKIKQETILQYAFKRGYSKPRGGFLKLLPLEWSNKVELFLKEILEFNQCKEKKRDHFDENGKPLSYVALLLVLIKHCGPQQIKSFFDLYIAFSVFFYVNLIVFVFRLKGFSLVERPRFSQEYKSIYQTSLGTLN